MALKADRNELDVDISFFYDEDTATRGGIVILDTVGSGAAMDQSQAKVKYAVVTGASIPVGVLLNDVVNIDLTRQHINWHKDEVQKGNKVAILKKGTIVTNMVDVTGAEGSTITAGATAYASSGTAGYLSASASSSNASRLAVGRFISTKDEDDYYKVEINLPNNG